jgi:hypothetical protein
MVWYDPLNKVWTKIPDSLPGPDFSDAISKILFNGNVLVSPVSEFGGNLIYNVGSNNWQRRVRPPTKTRPAGSN